MKDADWGDIQIQTLVDFIQRMAEEASTQAERSHETTNLEVEETSAELLSGKFCQRRLSRTGWSKEQESYAGLDCKALVELCISPRPQNGFFESSPGAFDAVDFHGETIALRGPGRCIG